MRLSRIALLIAGSVLLSCFSTIAPNKDAFVPGEGDHFTWTYVRGKTLLYRAEGEFDDWSSGVQAIWLDRTGRQVDEDTVRSGTDGIYEIRTYRTNVASVRVSVFKCSYDPNDPAIQFICCLDPTPCPTGCESPWDTSYTLQVAPGGTVYKDLKIYCEGTVPTKAD